MNTTSLTKMHHKLVAVTAERDHWKANHDNRVHAARLLTERTDMPMERIGAYKHYVAALEANQKLRERAESAESELLAVREDNHSMMLEIDGLRTERDRLAAELAKLRDQKPVAYVKYKATGGNVGLSWLAVPTGEFYPREGEPLYAAPVAAPAAPAVPAPEIPDGDDFNGTTPHMIQCIEALVSMSDRGVLAPHGLCGHARTLLLASANRLRQLPAPSVPEEWREFVKRTAEVGLHATNSGVECTCYRCVAIRGARALLQSVDHSEQTPEKVAPDCRTCANRGRINGLSQESYCDSCIYQGRGWRQNHFVDARKMVDTVSRRCEACAILPCSCK
jgi:hypothetical protein